MRIIAGLAKGRKLLSPEGYGVTRPTLDRVKEAMFSIIQNKIRDSIVLDVFAGTGSLGLEAVSRESKFCYLVDKSRETFSFLKQNVENLQFGEKCRCMNMDSYEALKELADKNIKFDIIFIDPPYRKDMIPKAIEIIDESSMLMEDGIIMTKIDSSEEIYNGSKSIVLDQHRKYGKTTVCIYKENRED
ncbi:MAG: 16S rRNA (guanine(966)-N(2))-methyltransferase RsmD [Clostridium sp.]|jgi:16S rRNA (guanine966-N2)-methyltransferase|uniref:16S rRNA (guanine(966)-N(2))-methyltransferase RsmD n=1 Tax=Clostridium sp. TaxID=1506 RepID=UPI0025C639CF|nr:16S rRNA (guanine(966)-N(2))-methyltransferase RsmD [Clostridium sp.]MCH3964027.1 16S rRNA (guanine(966)-N(2))-methyltransferase RsmD [Clostridium sp.]MCI1716228.1 16S rRNA (guanine(966)-N(2))-methyltransferase RsmD [Clostridium sp.]MCI1800532.1 16S rRNA (guanine(966)-N(2))-methyltransferase RsmD [Clostridium sp.]MCI1814405.1 16S rRNA (guanine(966)-N(2))-methyltransferase RsmD [Clostridium sp.]MCI1871304.1 16S rRNA (guanine(966)-N(2))-methyltransferase RsmD [Clostridium sp.]